MSSAYRECQNVTVANAFPRFPGTHKISVLASMARMVRTGPPLGWALEMQGIPMVLQWPLRDPGRAEGLHQLTRYSRLVQDVWFFHGKLRFAPNRKIRFYFGRPECSEMQGFPLFLKGSWGGFFFWQAY